ncbi:MAG: SspB family protein [Bosea sp. (in: a-proteobacteria)]
MTNPTPSKDLIRYDLLVQEALKGVVRKVIADAGREGLPGDHHFYVSFRTDFPGVRLSQRMRDKYPEEMTIVLQHQFWDMGITEHAFEVGLSFSGIPERLLIPFDALVGFFDPSVQFGLKFELNGDAAVSGAAGSASPVGTQDDKQPPALKLAGKAPALQNVGGGDALAIKPAEPVPPTKTGTKTGAKALAPSKPAAEPDPAGDDKGSAQVLSLDAFRKKP